MNSITKSGLRTSTKLKLENLIRRMIKEESDRAKPGTHTRPYDALWTDALQYKLRNAVKTLGTFEPADILPFIEEDLTQQEWLLAKEYLRFMVKNDLTSIVNDFDKFRKSKDFSWMVRKPNYGYPKRIKK